MRCVVATLAAVLSLVPIQVPASAQGHSATMQFSNLVRSGFWTMLAVVLVIALLPNAEAPTIFASDKLNHILAFAALSSAAALAWPKVNLVIPICLLAVYGGLIEIVQWRMALGRQGDWMDFAADLAAILVGTLIGRALGSIIRRMSPEPDLGH